jgi:hypothetical protein
MAKYLPDLRVGDDYSIELTVKNLSGNAQNITGYKFWLTLKSSFDLSDANAELQFSSTAGDNPNDEPVNGICFLYVPASITKNIPAGSYYYDIQQKAGANGGLSTVLPPVADYKDKIIVVPQITRAEQ